MINPDFLSRSSKASLCNERHESMSSASRRESKVERKTEPLGASQFLATESEMIKTPVSFLPSAINTNTGGMENGVCTQCMFCGLISTDPLKTRVLNLQHRACVHPRGTSYPQATHSSGGSIFTVAHNMVLTRAQPLGTSTAKFMEMMNR